MNKTFWQGKKVFVTGHTGFKGSWLVLWLNELGANVTGYALTPPTQPSLFELCCLERTMTSIEGDIRDGEKLRDVMRKAEPEIVIHMAAQPLVRESYRNPVETYETNVMGTVNVLEAVRGCKSVHAVVNVTTDKCYENREWAWGYRENEAMGGYDPYSSSKGCAELVTAAYRNSYFNAADYATHRVAIATARAGNVIGGGDWAEERLIPDCIKALSRQETVFIRSPQSIRPWQHVLEPLSGYLVLAERLYEDGPTVAEGWNFGPEDSDAKPVEWIVKKMCDLWGDGAGYRIDAGHHPHEAHYLKLDCSKAKAHLKWQPRWSLEKALEKIHEWVAEYEQGANVAATCTNQIQEYMNTNSEG